jgi:hypothetical protein
MGVGFVTFPSQIVGSRLSRAEPKLRVVVPLRFAIAPDVGICPAASMLFSIRDMPIDVFLNALKSTVSGPTIVEVSVGEL